MSVLILKKRLGFTLLELLAVVATIGVLAALLLPILSKAKIKAHRTACFSNVRQLCFAWSMYATDNGGRLVPSSPTNSPDGCWVEGDMCKLDEATNADLIRQGKLFGYTREVGIYRCPTDRGVTINGQKVSSVRSYSMNAFMGAREQSAGPIPKSAENYVWFFAKESDLRNPSQMSVILEEDERSINDGFFVIDPVGLQWFDLPAISSHRHGYSFSLSFADGHSEVWKHRDPRTMLVKSSRTEQAGNTDLVRMARSATLPR